MRFWIISLALMVLLMGCNINDGDSTVSNITLEPSQIAANNFEPNPPTAVPPTAEPVVIGNIVSNAAPVEETPQEDSTDAVATEQPSDASTQATEAPTEQTAPPVAEQTEAPVEDTAQTDAEAPTEVESPAEPVILPTSNSPDIQALTDNPTLLLTVNMDAECFLTGEPIPFELVITNLDPNPIYFYEKGQWKLSINNSPVGPDIVSREPQLTEEFIELAANATYARAEEDISSWVLSLGPGFISFASETGLGLAPNEYWVTFLYTNDKDGLTEQFGGTFLIDRAAWRGTTVATEKRFRVVEDLANCQGE